MQMQLPSWLMKLGFCRSNLDNDYTKEDKFEKEVSCHPLDANIIISETLTDKHIVQLDLDVEHLYVPSTTSGHGHLYINVELTWREYESLLKLLATFGIIQKGYVECAIERKHTGLRVPGLDKNNPEHNKGIERKNDAEKLD